MTNAWEEKMPFFAEEIKKGVVHRYDGSGTSRELTEEQNKTINIIEKKYSDVRVVAVLDAAYRMSDGDIIKMEDYILLDRKLKKDNAPVPESDGSVEFLTYTYNKSWDEAEMGYIWLIEKAGMVNRVA